MLTILDYITGVLDAVAMYMYYQTLYDKRRRDVSSVWVIVVCIVTQFFYEGMTQFMMGDTSQRALYLRSLLAIATYFILTYFYRLKLQERVFAAVSIMIINIVFEDGSSACMVIYCNKLCERLNCISSDFAISSSMEEKGRSTF